ncbi:MAG: hypothetical protein IJN17_01935 [Clostridia bacterium]|nr:hypothetical protein [Clostridia bacterium]
MKLNPMRQKVVDYMKSMATLKWSPEEDIVVYNPGNNGCTRMLSVFQKGKTYFGPPYINANMCTKETYNEKRKGAYIPFSGTREQLDSIKSAADIEAIGGEILESAIKNAFTYPGNDCIGAVLLAWNNVINNGDRVQKLQFCFTTIPTHNYGVVPVGEYDYSDCCENESLAMCQKNGEQVMAKAYTFLQPGDAVSHVSSRGSHIRMVIDYPHVEYTTDENGNRIIDLEKSYVTSLDQAGGAPVRFIVGTCMSSMQVITDKFSKLYKEGSLPVTIPELVAGENEQEETYIEDFSADKLVSEGTLAGVIKSNRQIIAVRAEITDGKTLHNTKDIISMCDLSKRTRYYHAPKYDLADLPLGKIDFAEGKTYTLNVYALTSGNEGEEIKVVSNYRFTK